MLNGEAMNQRARKFVGSMTLLIFLLVYCLAAMGVAANYVLQLGNLAQGVYFVVAGLLWLPVAMVIVKWMQRPRES